ncbi:MAG: trypsin-like serine protease [Gammaproteobacteria bacterium]|nr:trypsin-like serine protease [Gammaproteobacteria bacterium]
MWRSLVIGLASVLVAIPNAIAIVHGKAVRQSLFEDRYPWAVAVENPASGGVCSAALISPTHVISAAHCTWPGKRLLVGHTSRQKARVVEVADVIRHPDYDKETNQFDVGLFRLTEAVDIEPVKLVSRGEYLLLVLPDAEAEIMGWGKRPDSDFSDRLVRAGVQLGNLGMRGTYLIYESQGAPCGGDSGGPLVLEGLDRKPVLVGVASATDGNLCSTGGGAAAYTNVAAVRQFIEKHVPDLP